MKNRQHAASGASLHWAVRMNHRNRVVCSLGLALLLGAQLYEAQAPVWAHALLIGQMGLLPHLLLAVTRRASDPMASESCMMRLDAAMLGLWVGALHFPLWITVVAFASVSLHPMVFNGPRAFAATLLLAAGAGGVGMALFHWTPPGATSVAVTALAVGYLALYLLALTHGAYINATLATRLRRELKDSRAALQARLQEVERLQEQLREQALQDPLTGMFNRRYLDAFLERELARTRREGNPLTVMILDIDHFKQINDSHGHMAGDQVLRHVATLVKDTVRASDVICRFGGEEFLVVLPGTSLEGSVEIAHRLRERLEARPTRFDGKSIHCTISIGVATRALEVQGADDLISSADRALYSAKLGGRNSVVAAPRQADRHWGTPQADPTSCIPFTPA